MFIFQSTLLLVEILAVCHRNKLKTSRSLENNAFRKIHKENNLPVVLVTFRNPYLIICNYFKTIWTVFYMILSSYSALWIHAKVAIWFVNTLNEIKLIYFFIFYLFILFIYLCLLRILLYIESEYKNVLKLFLRCINRFIWWMTCMTLISLEVN